MRRCLIALELFIVFLMQFIIANLQVTAWIFAPNRFMKPAIVEVPLQLEDEWGLWILSLLITLTPGSLIVDISDDKRSLFVHILHAKHPESEVQLICQRYERRLLQIIM
ncbi:MAG: Na+/H+ antiporter subunit E [Bdellovibrio sp.]